MTGLGISNWMTIHFRPRPKWTSIRPRVTDPQNPELNDTKWQFKLRRQDRSFSISDSWDRSSKAMVHCQWTVQFQMTVHFRFDPINQSEGEFENYPLANRKTSLTILGPSPRYFWTNSDPTTRINDAVVWWATAFANIVWKLWRHIGWRHRVDESSYLSAAWWAVHEDTAWWINTNLLVKFIMCQRKFNCFTDFLFLSVQTTNIAEMSHSMSYSMTSSRRHHYVISGITYL